MLSSKCGTALFLLAFLVFSRTAFAEDRSDSPFDASSIRGITVRLLEHPITGFSDDRARDMPVEHIPKLLSYLDSLSPTESNILLTSAPEICELSIKTETQMFDASVVWPGAKGPLFLKIADKWYVGKQDKKPKDIVLSFYGEVMEIFGLDH